MANITSLDSKATTLKHSLDKLKLEPHFGLVKGILDAFKPESALLLGSAPRTASLLHERVDRLMAVDFEQARYNKSLARLSSKAEFYPKSFPVYDDQVITGDEGLDLSDLYSRIKGFFKESDLLIVDQPADIALGAFNYFANTSDIIILRGVDPSSVFHNGFNKYRLVMRYGEVSSVLVKNHVPVGFEAIRDIIYAGNSAFYKSLSLDPSFRFEKA
tara:strand:+ start:16709 stop:17356 length:648 start_codon:yes stop_codon:yes gene_type:complete